MYPGILPPRRGSCFLAFYLFVLLKISQVHFVFYLVNCLQNYIFVCFAVDELEQHMPSKSIEPWSVTSQPIKSVKILEDERNTVRSELRGRDGAMKTHHSALGGTSEEIVKEHAVAVERGNTAT